MPAPAKPRVRARPAARTGSRRRRATTARPSALQAARAMREAMVGAADLALAAGRAATATAACGGAATRKASARSAAKGAAVKKAAVKKVGVKKAGVKKAGAAKTEAAKTATREVRRGGTAAIAVAEAAAEAGREIAAAARRAAEGAADLAAGIAAHAAGHAAGEAQIPLGARFEKRRWDCPAGARRYRLYIPASTLLRRPRGLVLMLHGCDQTPEDFARGTRMNAVAETHRLIVAWPAQTRAHHPAGCWSWHRPSHQRRGEGEPEILASLTKALAREFRLRRPSCFVAGLSAGASMAALLGRRYPDVFAAMGLHSGLAPEAARSLPAALAAMKRGGAAAPHRAEPGARQVRAILFQGMEDDVVHPANAGHAAEAAMRGARVSRRRPQLETGRRGGRACTRSLRVAADGRAALEQWMIEGLGHAWSGGDPAGSYAEAAGPDAAEEMARFFLGLKGKRLAAG